MTPLEHLAWASKLPPLEAQTPKPLTSSQQALLRKLVTHPGEVQERVRQQLQYWTGRKSKLAAVTQEYRRTLDDFNVGTLGKLDLYLLEENAYSGWACRC